jgi:uncharacterized membrane protein YebE (DUF533 family)
MARVRKANSEERATARSAAEVPVVHLHEDDVERIVKAVVAALRQDRLVDEIARRVRAGLDEASES